MSYLTRISAIAGVAVALVAAAAGILVGSTVMSGVTRTSEASRSFGLATLRDAIENNLALGLSLDQMVAVAALLDRERRRDPSVLSIDIVDRSGRVVFSTDPAAVGRPMPTTWITRMGAGAPADPQAQAIWTVASRDELVSGLNVIDPIGSVAGAVVLSASLGEGGQRDVDLLLPTAAATLGGGLLAVLLALAGTRLHGRRTVADLAAAGAAVRGRAPRRAPGPLAALAVAADQTWRAAEEEIGNARRELEAIDEKL